MSKHLLTGDQFKELARPTSLHVDDAEINAYVRECEDVHIIPAIGYARFKQLTESEDLSDADKVLLEGGEWVQKVERCECRAEEGERLQYCKGLRCALAYFVYGRMLKADGSLLSRAGFVQHEDQYARHVDDSKLKQYNDVIAVAEQYLASCLAYIKSLTGTAKPLQGTRCKIHAIGD